MVISTRHIHIRSTEVSDEAYGELLKFHDVEGYSTLQIKGLEDIGKLDVVFTIGLRNNKDFFWPDDILGLHGLQTFSEFSELYPALYETLLTKVKKELEPEESEEPEKSSRHPSRMSLDKMFWD